MNTTQTVRKDMPPWLIEAITEFMDETGADRIDIRRLPGEAEDEEPRVNVVMSDNEEPESVTLHSGSMALIPVSTAE